MQHLHHILKSNIETNVNFKTNLNVSRNLSHIDHSSDMIDNLLNLRLWLCLLRKKNGMDKIYMYILGVGVGSRIQTTSWE